MKTYVGVLDPVRQWAIQLPDDWTADDIDYIQRNLELWEESARRHSEKTPRTEEGIPEQPPPGVGVGEGERANG